VLVKGSEVAHPRIGEVDPSVALGDHGTGAQVGRPNLIATQSSSQTGRVQRLAAQIPPWRLLQTQQARQKGRRRQGIRVPSLGEDPSEVGQQQQVERGLGCACGTCDEVQARLGRTTRPGSADSFGDRQQRLPHIGWPICHTSGQHRVLGYDQGVEGGSQLLADRQTLGLVDPQPVGLDGLPRTPPAHLDDDGSCGDRVWHVVQSGKGNSREGSEADHRVGVAY
jgi:hypothetical protein